MLVVAAAVLMLLTVFAVVLGRVVLACKRCGCFCLCLLLMVAAVVMILLFMFDLT